MRFAIAAASILALAAAAAADTIKVPQDQPTIQAGVDAAATGDTVSVSKGVYFENVTVATPGIKIVGKGAILDGNIAGVDGDCLTINSTDVVVQGIGFRNGNFQLSLFGDRAQVLKCTFQGSGADAIGGDGPDEAVITSCKFLYTGGESIDFQANDVVVSKCTFSRGGSYGVRLFGDRNRVESSTFTGVDDNGAVSLDGDFAVISKNKASNVDGTCYEVLGNAGTVDGNKGDRLDSRLVSVTGNLAAVSGNTAGYCRGGILVTGNGALISANKVSNNGSSDAIAVVGDAFTVTGNTVAGTWDDADGISADFATATSGGTIEGNKVSDTAGYGFNLDTVNSVVIRNNSATRCGQDDKGGFYVVGNLNTLDGLKVTDAEGVGIEVDGDGNDTVSCSVKKSGSDGIRVDGGTGNTFDACSATSCGGEGFDNRGVGTIVGNGKFTKNRIDVANDANGGATIPGGLATVTFSTGGLATQPEVD